MFIVRRQLSIPDASTMKNVLLNLLAVVLIALLLFGASSPAALAQTISNIAINPDSVIGGASASGVITLTSAAPTGGISIALSSSNTAVATVLSNINIAAGLTSANFQINTSAVAYNTVPVITATAGGVSKSANIFVTTSAVMYGVTITPAAVIGGIGATATLTLNGPAPTGGANVTLTSSDPAASVLSSAFIAAGATSTTTPVTTYPVPSNTLVTISGVYGRVSRPAYIQVNAPVLSSVTLTPSNISGGNVSTGTVTLTGAAPSAGLAISLTSSNTAVATVGSSVLVPSGSTFVNFPVNTSSVTATGTASITGTSGSAKAAMLTVVPVTATTPVFQGGSVTGNIGTAFSYPISFTNSPTSYGAINLPAGLSINTSTGTISGTPTVGGTWNIPVRATNASGTGTGVLAITIINPIPVITSPVSVAAIVSQPFSYQITATNNPTSYYVKDPYPGINYNSSTGLISGIWPQSGDFDLQLGAVNSYGVGVGTVAVLVRQTPTITSFSPVSGQIGTIVTINGSGFSGVNIVKFNGTTATTFNVVNPAVITAVVPDGAVTGKITVSNIAGSATSTDVFTVLSNPMHLSNLSINATGGVGGTSFTGTVTLSQPAPSSGVVVNLHASSSVIGPINPVTIPSGARSAQFTVTTQSVAAAIVVTIVGDSGGWAQATLLTLLPASQALTIANLSAQSGNGSVILTWNDLPPGSIQGYKVYRNGVALTTIPREVATFADTGLTNGTTYQYQVSLVNTIGQESNLTPAISATPTSSLATLIWVNPPTSASGVISLSAQLSSGVNSSEYLLLVDGKQVGIGGSEPTSSGSMGPVIATLDTTTLSNGPHVMQFVSSDGFIPSATIPINVQTTNLYSSINFGSVFDPSAHEALPIDITLPVNTANWTVTITDDTTSSTIRSWNGVGSNVHLAWDGGGSIFGDAYDTVSVFFQNNDGSTGDAEFPATTVMGNPGGLALVDYISDNRSHDIALASSIKAAFTQFHNTDGNFNGIVLNPYSAGSTIQEKYNTYEKIRSWMTNTLVDFYLFGHGRGQQTLTDPRPQRSVWVGANFFPKRPLDTEEFAAVVGDPIRNFVIPDFINGRSYHFVFIDSCFSAGGVDIPGNPNDGDPGNPVLTQWHDAFNIDDGDFGGGTFLGFNGTNQLNTLVDGSKSPWLIWRQYLWAYLSVNGTTVQSAIDSATSETEREISVGNVHSTYDYPWESKYGYSRLQQSDYSAYTLLP